MNFKDLSLETIIENIKSWKTTKEEVWNYFQKRIEKYEDRVQAFNFVNENGLHETWNWILAGVPIAIKDIFCEKWIPTTASSKMLEWFKPPYNATTIEKLLEEWMSSLGKTTLDEFAMGSSNETSAFKKAINPRWTNKIPWWSSWWSAAAVAAWLAPAALWTDTWWSIRQPASMCNIVWFKPSYWRNSRYWIMPMSSSLDTPWTLTKTVKDSAILYEIMNGEDKLENTSLPWKDIINPEIWNKKDLKWYKIWVPKEYFEEGLDQWVRDRVNDAIDKMKELWAEVVDISLPMTKYAVATYYIVSPAEVSTNMWRYDWLRYWYISNDNYDDLDEMYINNRTEWLWEEVKRRVILWSYVLSAWFYEAYFIKATKVRTLIIEDFNKAFEKIDAIVCPVCPDVAWEIWAKIEDPLKMYLADAYTIPSALAWLPWISVPAWFAPSTDWKKEMLPVWLQIITARLNEEKLFEIAHVYEQATKFWEQTPPWFED